MTDLNLFATVLTNAAPSSNYRGESEENRTVLQKITKGDHEFTVISPESMRNALREMLAKRGLDLNRRRLHEEGQLAVEFKAYPDASKYADDFLFGFMVADPPKGEKLPAKRDSVLRMNMAVALTPYRFNATLHQSPLHAGKSAFKNATSSALLHREVSWTAYQYPFALALGDCRSGEAPKWTADLLDCIGELSEVAGGHARSFYEMSPTSIVLRLTRSLVAGFNTYGFSEQGGFADLSRLNAKDLPGKEFWLGGELVRTMPAEERKRLEAEGAHLFENPQKLLAEVAKVTELRKA
jgi:CRISPR-associated protein Cst2